MDTRRRKLCCGVSTFVQIGWVTSVHDFAGGGAAVANEVGEAYSVPGVAGEAEAGDRGSQVFDFGDAGLVAYFILGQGFWPAPDESQCWIGDGAEDVC